MTNAELKPCPFCGGEASVWTTSAYSGDSAEHVLGCSDCNVYAPFAGVFELSVPAADDIDAWNTRAAPKVKPLEWLGGGGRWHAGDYVIEDVSYGQREVRRLLRAAFGTTYIGDFAGGKPLEAAKAAAQADYERRILDALE